MSNHKPHDKKGDGKGGGGGGTRGQRKQGNKERHAEQGNNLGGRARSFVTTAAMMLYILPFLAFALQEPKMEEERQSQETELAHENQSMKRKIRT